MKIKMNDILFVQDTSTFRAPVKIIGRQLGEISAEDIAHFLCHTIKDPDTSSTAFEREHIREILLDNTEDE